MSDLSNRIVKRIVDSLPVAVPRDVKETWEQWIDEEVQREIVQAERIIRLESRLKSVMPDW